MGLKQGNKSGGLDYFMIITVFALVGAFLVWANYTHLDLVTRGAGRVVAPGQNKNIQSPDRGLIATYMVEEGSFVKQGEIIATINPIAAEGDLEQIEIQMSNLEARLIRLDAELSLQSVEVVEELIGAISQLMIESEVTLMISRRASLDAEVKSLNQEYQKIEKALDSIEAEISGLQILQNLLKKEMSELLPLVEVGALGSSERYRLEREDAELQTELKVLTEQELQTQLEIKQIDSKILVIKQEYETKIYEERTRVISEISKLRAQLPAIRQKLRETDIRSPIEGVVNRVFFNNVGAVVGSGEVIAEIVPTGSNLFVEAFIDPKDIATVEPGQNVKISLTAYEPAKYGYLLGTLTKVAADTVYRDDTRSSSYAVKTSIDSQIFEDDNTPVLIVPGMVAQVDIIRGERTILEYFWQPVAKIKDTAFRE